MLHASLRGRQVRALLLTVALAAGAAQLPAPARADAGEQLSQAAALSRDGQHEAAARIYEQQARRVFRAWDARLSLLAAREYLEAGRTSDAARVLSKVTGPLRGDDVVLYGRVKAELALARGDGPAALGALAAIPRPWPAPLAQELLLLEGRADFLAGRTLEGIRAFEERGQVLGGAEARADNYRLLVDELGRSDAVLTVPTGATDGERAWIELAQIRAMSQDDAAVVAQRAADWRTRHANHPGAGFLRQPASNAGGVPVPVAAPGQGSATVALLLPLSGRQQAAGVAVRDGFIAASLARDDTGRKVLVYDTAALGPAQAYQRALADGAGAVVGPLTREDVAALAESQPLAVPTLALNAYAGAGAPPAFLFEFTLDPEQEARAAARRIAADGRTHGIALFPRSPWGERIYAAFTAELQQAGVSLTSAQYYEPGSRDFSGPLRAALGRYGGAADRSDGRPPPKRDPVAEARDGPQFAFIAATASTMRTIVPQLRFQMTYALPVYATSDAWDPVPRAVPDLDGMVYPEFPWVLQGGEGARGLWEVLQHEWAANARGRVRLYAFGHDAATVAAAITSGHADSPIDGLTGRLALGSDAGVHRELDWAQIVDGRPQPAAVTVSTAPPR